MHTPIRLGVLGAGGHATTSHLRFLHGATVTGLHDPSRKSIKRARRLVGRRTPVYDSPEALLASGIDAVLTMTPDEWHPLHLTMAVGAGVPTLCEKPLAVNGAGLMAVRNALELAERKGLLVASCHPRRNTIDSLPYGWIKVQLEQLENQLGTLERVKLSSIYPKPRKRWKEDRSFLEDKFVHDADWLFFLLGDLPIEATRLADSYNHYEVEGQLQRGESVVRFHCDGTRLHNDRDSFVETIVLNFEHGSCVVHVKTGEVRFANYATRRKWTMRLSPMDSLGYDCLNGEIMRRFVGALRGTEQPVHTPAQLLTNTEVVVELAGQKGYYRTPA